MKYSFLLLVILVFACSEAKRERFNYTLIKSMLELTDDQTKKFDQVTGNYTQVGKDTYEKYHEDKEQLRRELQKVGDSQDAEMRKILNDTQYAIYEREIKIERSGREQHNMKLIKESLSLDSMQRVKFDLANEAFYKTLIDNHDNYHGKPDVYRQYYKQLDVSRKEAFRGFMTDDQYNTYEQLADQHNIGKSEH